MAKSQLTKSTNLYCCITKQQENKKKDFNKLFLMTYQTYLLVEPASRKRVFERYLFLLSL